MPMVPEHPVMGAAVGLPAPESEASGMAAPAGELPELLSPAEVAAAMSELARVASAPDVEMDDVQAPLEPPAAKAETVAAPEVVIPELTPAETVDGAEPMFVEPVTPEALETSRGAGILCQRRAAR